MFRAVVEVNGQPISPRFPGICWLFQGLLFANLSLYQQCIGSAHLFELTSSVLLMFELMNSAPLLNGSCAVISYSFICCLANFIIKIMHSRNSFYKQSRKH